MPKKLYEGGPAYPKQSLQHAREAQAASDKAYYADGGILRHSMKDADDAIARQKVRLGSNMDGTPSVRKKDPKKD